MKRKGPRAANGDLNVEAKGKVKAKQLQLCLIFSMHDRHRTYFDSLTTRLATQVHSNPVTHASHTKEKWSAFLVAGRLSQVSAAQTSSFGFWV